MRTFGLQQKKMKLMHGPVNYLGFIRTQVNKLDLSQMVYQYAA
jgi:hypothetical protein